MFPDLPEAEAVSRLWDAIFAASRVDGPDPVAAWEAHNAALHARMDALNTHRFAALRFFGPGTDLTVGLADDHEWCGGASASRSGIVCNANIPTEEVFTTPHRTGGRHRHQHQAALLPGHPDRRHPGALRGRPHRRGQGPHRRRRARQGAGDGRGRAPPRGGRPGAGLSAISASGLLFYNTLYDENAASHIALGQAYSKCFRNGGADYSEDDLAARGANRSLIHIDWMIGSDRIDVDGLSAEGRAVP